MAIQENPYADLEQLLFKGFIEERFQFKGIDFVLKSMSDQEFQRVKDRTPSSHPSKNLFYDAWYLSYSIVQVNGIYFLENRDSNALLLFKSLLKWPHKAINRLIYRCIGLNNRITEAYKKFEAYCYEPQSRAYWKAYQGIPLNSTAVTGVPGTETTALSPLQVQWIAYNRSEDDKSVFDVQWNYVRWLAAFMNHKAAQKLDEEASQQREREEDYRKSVIDKARGRIAEDVPLDSPYSRTSRDKELEKLMYDLDVVINDKKDAHELAMDASREAAIQEYRSYRKAEFDARVEALKNQSEMANFGGSLSFDIIDQKNMIDVSNFEQKRHLLTAVLGITRDQLDAIDREFEIPAELLQSSSAIQSSTKSTILPINFKPPNNQ